MLIERNGEFTITKTEDFNFEVHQNGTCIGCFRTLGRCRDLIEMLTDGDEK